MDGNLSWIDIFICVCVAVSFFAGIFGRGILHISFYLAAAAVAAGAGYIFAAEAAEALGSGRLTAGAAVFASVFLLLVSAFSLPSKLPGAQAAMRITDGIVSAAVVGSVAVFAAGAARDLPSYERWVENSVVYPRAAEFYRLGAEKAEKHLRKKNPLKY